MSAAHETLRGNAPILLQSALYVASNPPRAEWLLRPYVERQAMILMVGAEGTYKSFLALHWALTIATEKRQLVIYLSAEGRGLWKRLRAWCIHHHPRQPWAETLNKLPFLALEQPIDLSSSERIGALIAAIEEVSEKRGRPVLIVVDTMSRNSNGSIERSTEDATLYLNGLDQLLRARYGCSVILIHHIGHAARDRARGPFALIGNTDANFLLERPDLTRPIVTVRSGRMKDCEPPMPFELEAHTVSLDAIDEDGKTVTSLIMKGTGNAPDLKPKPTGKAQKQLLAELERLAALSDCISIWTEAKLREVGRELGMHKSTARDAVVGLRQLGYLTHTVGGSRLSHVSLNGTNGTNGDEMTNSSRGVRDEKDESPLGLVLSSRPRPPPGDGH